MNHEQKFIEIPFGAKDSELKGWEYTIPEGMEAIVKDGKVIVKEKESEDERIRKHIVTFLLEADKMGDAPEEVAKLLAYLEKQKPQNQCVDVIKMSALLAADRLASAEMTGRLKERKEILENPEKYGLCKPAEWSEEDVDAITTAIRACRYMTENYENSTKQYEDAIEKLKSLRPRLSDEEIQKIRSEEYTKGFNDAAFGGKLKEWSVEDEDRIRQIERIAQQAGCTQKLQEEIHDWLKSLRPSWKPSEEQMEGLPKWKETKPERGKAFGSGPWYPSGIVHDNGKHVVFFRGYEISVDELFDKLPKEE